jgi:hypothetical protein
MNYHDQFDSLGNQRALPRPSRLQRLVFRAALLACAVGFFCLTWVRP